jgi:Calcineurin-like phosphoesterase
MAQAPEAATTDAPRSAGDVTSSRTSAAAAGWIECRQAENLTGLFRPGYVPQAFSWVSLRPLLQSRNDRVARWIEDPVFDERRRWVEAQRRKGVDDELTVRRFADRAEVSFVVLGDPGEGDASQYHVLRPLAAVAPGIDFTYVCSDVIYPAGDINEYYDKFFWPYRDLPGPIYAIPGNHDWYDGLHGFMAHFCDASPELRPPPGKPASGWRRRLRELTWRREAKANAALIREMRRLRSEQPAQPAPYFAIDAGPLLVVGIDTGIQAAIDEEQGDWLRQVSRSPKPKILLSGKPLYVDAERVELGIGGTERTVNEIVDDPAHGYVAVIAGDIHNYQRYPIKLADGRTIQHIVSGAAGAYTKATHKIPRVALEGCSEEEFRCYPRRGDSLAAYSRLYDQRFGFNRGKFVVPFDQAPKIMSRILAGDVDPTRASDHDVEITKQAWRAARLVLPLPGQAVGPFHRNFSELLDWNDPPPPLFKSFLRVDASGEAITIRCFAATGCEEHQDDPPLEDWLTATRGDDGRWRWTVNLA